MHQNNCYHLPKQNHWERSRENFVVVVNDDVPNDDEDDEKAAVEEEHDDAYYNHWNMVNRIHWMFSMDRQDDIELRPAMEVVNQYSYH